ncbi:MAG: hypothetical protein J6V07_00265 [Clostridia bacterium]|nr:hypothetical protein [Clostridia bacterium]
MWLRRLLGMKENTKSRAYRTARAVRLHGLTIRYVTERHDDNEDVIGRGGNLSVHGDELLVFSSGEILLRAKVDELDVSELMSGDGVILTAPNLEEGGRVRTMTAHYVYHRK